VRWPEDPFHAIKFYLIEVALLLVFVKELVEFVWNKLHH
jgi:hypothetical protein